MDLSETIIDATGGDDGEDDGNGGSVDVEGLVTTGFDLFQVFNVNPGVSATPNLLATSGLLNWQLSGCRIYTTENSSGEYYVDCTGGAPSHMQADFATTDLSMSLQSLLSSVAHSAVHFRIELAICPDV